MPERLAHPHALRGYYATTLAGEGVPIQEIKARLGHASIETTARYLAELGDGGSVSATSSIATTRRSAVSGPLTVSPTPPVVRVVDDLPHPSIDGGVQRGMTIDGEPLHLFDDDGACAALDASRVGRARMCDLRGALLELSQGDDELPCWEIRRGRGLQSVWLILDPASGQVCAFVDLGLDADHDPCHAASLVSMLSRVVKSRSARLVLDDDPLERASVMIAVDGVDRSVGELIECAADVQAILEALDGGPLTYASACELILSGNGGALVGAREGAWLDAKAAPYQSDARGAYELAKDTAAFANSVGGLILIPATTRSDHGAEVIAEVGELDRMLVDTQSWTDLIARRVYPHLIGVRVQFVGENRGQVVVIVPSQPEERKPFVVRDALQGGRTVAHAVTIPWRDGDRTLFDDIGVVHAALQAHRRATRANDDILERVHLAAFPPSSPTSSQAPATSTCVST